MDIENKHVIQEERSLIENYFQEPAELISQWDVNFGKLIIWKNANSLPSRRACTFRDEKFHVVIPNFDEKAFGAMLEIIVRDSNNVEDVCNFLPLISPGLRKVIKELRPYMKDINEIWHPPTLMHERFVAFVENVTLGTLEQIVISPDCGMKLETVGKGIQMHLK